MTSLRKLARDLGVSPATVSRALAGHPHVTDEMRSRILIAAAAAGLATTTAGDAVGRQLVVLHPRRTRPIFADTVGELMVGATQGARQVGAHVTQIILEDEMSDPLHDLPGFSQTRPSAALLPFWRNPQAIAGVSASLPSVLVGPAPPGLTGEGVRSADFDAGEGLLQLLDHLLALGHCRIAMLSDTLNGWYGCQRHGAAVSAATLRNVDIRLVRLDGDQGWSRVRAQVKSGITGWIADGMHTGTRLIARMRGWGYQVPADVSVASFTFAPPYPGTLRLTGMRGDWRAVGRLAARVALTRPDPLDPYSRILVHSRLEPGETTGPAP